MPIVTSDVIAEALSSRGFHIDHVAGRIVGSLNVNDDEELRVLVQHGNGGFGWDTFWRRPGRMLHLHVWLSTDLSATLERYVPEWLARPLPQRELQ